MQLRSRLSALATHRHSFFAIGLMAIVAVGCSGQNSLPTTIAQLTPEPATALLTSTQTPNAGTSSDSKHPSVIMKSMTIKDRDGKTLYFETLPKRPRTKAELQSLISGRLKMLKTRLDKSAATSPTVAASSQPVTNDVCFDGDDTGLTFAGCVLEGASVTLEWALSPMPANGSITAFWTPSNFSFATSDSVFPTLSGAWPYETLETFQVSDSAQPNMDYVGGPGVRCVPNPSYTGLTVTCNPIQVAIGVLCATQYNHCPVAEIDNSAGTPVANPSPTNSPTAVPGEQQMLTSKIQAMSGTGSYTVPNLEWVPASYSNYPAAIEGNTFTDPQAAPTFLSDADLANPMFTFYWVGPASTEGVGVADIAVRSDKQEIAVAEAVASFGMDVPPVTFVFQGQNTQISTTGSTIGGNIEPFLSSGNQVAEDLYAMAGIMNKAGGYLEITQEDLPTITFTSFDGRVETYVNGEQPSGTSSPPSYEADGCAVYNEAYANNLTGQDVEQSYIDERAGNAAVSDLRADEPQVGTLGWQKVTANGLFVDFLMYRPPGVHSIWTSLGNLSWSWSGTAVASSETAFPKLTQSTSPGTITANTDPFLPQWSGQNFGIGNTSSNCSALPSS